MVIIAESGATKTDWRSISDDGTVCALQTRGINPVTMGNELIREILSQAIPFLNPKGKTVRKVFFYGAGLVSHSASCEIAATLDIWCPFAEIECHSDLEAAAKSLFGDGKGVAAIIGTGSNSCLCEGGAVVRNIRPGGFILGDEGSGAALGKMFVSDYVKDLVPAQMKQAFDNAFGLDYSGIVSKVYKSDAPSGFLAEVGRFVFENSGNDYASGLLEANFRNFIERSLVRYECDEVGVVGSFGHACRDILEKLGKEYGLRFMKFVKAPIDELVNYHCNVI